VCWKAPQVGFRDYRIHRVGILVATHFVLIVKLIKTIEDFPESGYGVNLIVRAGSKHILYMKFDNNLVYFNVRPEIVTDVYPKVDIEFVIEDWDEDDYWPYSTYFDKFVTGTPEDYSWVMSEDEVALHIVMESI